MILKLPAGDARPSINNDFKLPTGDDARISIRNDFKLPTGDDVKLPVGNNDRIPTQSPPKGRNCILRL